MLFYRLAYGYLVVSGDVGDPLEKKNALDNPIGVLHLLDGFLPDRLKERLVSPRLAHLGVDEVLVDPG